MTRTENALPSFVLHFSNASLGELAAETARQAGCAGNPECLGIVLAPHLNVDVASDRQRHTPSDEDARMQIDAIPWLARGSCKILIRIQP